MSSSSIGPAPGVFAGAVQPQMSPPRGLQVDGANAQAGPFVAASSRPVISWLAPLTGTPTVYQLSIRQLFIDTSLNRTRTRRVGSLVVPASSTSARLPPGILSSGASYVVVVSGETRSGGQYTPTTPYYDYTSGSTA